MVGVRIWSQTAWSRLGSLVSGDQTPVGHASKADSNDTAGFCHRANGLEVSWTESINRRGIETGRTTCKERDESTRTWSLAQAREIPVTSHGGARTNVDLHEGKGKGKYFFWCFWYHAERSTAYRSPSPARWVAGWSAVGLAAVGGRGLE